MVLDVCRRHVVVAAVVEDLDPEPAPASVVEPAQHEELGVGFRPVVDV